MSFQESFRGAVMDLGLRSLLPNFFHPSCCYYFFDEMLAKISNMKMRG